MLPNLHLSLYKMDLSAMKAFFIFINSLEVILCDRVEVVIVRILNFVFRIVLGERRPRNGHDRDLEQFNEDSQR